MSRLKKEFDLFTPTKKAMRNDKTTCASCGNTKKCLDFFLGASKDPDWTMIEGTGKITCPDCYAQALAQAKVAIDGLPKV